GASTYYDYLRAGWQGVSGGGEGWRQALRRGGVFPADGAQGAGIGLAAGAAAATPGAAQAVAATNVATSAQAPTAPQADTGSMAAAGASSSAQPMEFEGAGGDANFNLVVYPSYRFYDGRTANR